MHIPNLNLMDNYIPKIAVFPGSFDPITRGHEALVKRALPLFDKVIVAIGNNTEKKKYFNLEQRQLFLKETFKNYLQVEIAVFEGLTTSFCKQVGARFILRGLRSVTDFEFEQNIAQNNRVLTPETETVFLLTDPGYMHITSTIVRDIHHHGGNIHPLIPEALKNLL